MKCDVIIPVGKKDKLKVIRSLYAYRKEINLINSFLIGLDDYKLRTHITSELLLFIFNLFYRRKIKITRQYTNIHASLNRQILSESATSEIIFYQDADDIPHPKRVSTILKIFQQNPDCFHLCHCYCYINEAFNDLNDNLISLKALWEIYFKNGYENSINMTHRYGKHLNLRLALGVPIIRKRVLEQVRWKNINERAMLKQLGYNGEDHEFNMDCLFQFNKSFAYLDKPYRYMRVQG